MHIKRETKLRNLRTIQVGRHFGLPAARFLVGSVVKSSHIGPGAERRAWESYRSYGDSRWPIGSLS